MTNSSPSTTPTMPTKRSRNPGSVMATLADPGHGEEHAHHLERLDTSGDGPAGRAVQAEDLLVDEGEQRRDAEQRHREERDGEPDPADRPHPSEHPHRAPGPLRRIGHEGGRFVRPRLASLVVAAHRLVEAHRQQHEHEGGHREDEERHAEAEVEGEHAGDERPEDLAHRVRLAMDGEHLHARRRLVVVGQQ